MNGTDELERRITERLHGYSRLAPDHDGWEAVLARIEHRGRVRTRRRAAATGVAVAGIVASLVVFTGDDATRVSTTPAGPAAPDRPGDAAAGDWLPRLAFEVPGSSLTYASSSAADTPYPDLGPLLVYGAPGDGLLGPGPVVFVRLVPAGAAYGIGQGEAVQDVDVAGRAGRIFSSGDPNLSLGWYRADGSIVHLLGVGVSDDDLLTGGRAIEEALAAGQLPPAALPGGVELRRSTPADTSPAAQSELDYRFDGGFVALRLLGGGTYRLDDLVADRLASSLAWRATTVDGRHAVLSTYQGSTGVGGVGRTLLWAITDGVVAELSANGLTEAELAAAADSIQPVSEEGWQRLVAKSDAVRSVPEPGQAKADSLLTTVTVELCQARAAWLRARADGDPKAEAAAVAGLRAVMEKGAAGGLGDTGDILVVAQRLLDTMAAGDEARVSSIPEGGACS